MRVCGGSSSSFLTLLQYEFTEEPPASSIMEAHYHPRRSKVAVDSLRVQGRPLQVVGDHCRSVLLFYLITHQRSKVAFNNEEEASGSRNEGTKCFFFKYIFYSL